MLDRLNSRLVTFIGRKTYFQRDLDSFDIQPDYKTIRPDTTTSLDESNLVSSECDDGMHAPAIDLDFPAHLITSSTPGNHHLFIDKKLTWSQYQALLRGFYDAGLIQRGWYNTAITQKRSYLRLPHVKKTVNKKAA
jgi:hypothetical protein